MEVKFAGHETEMLLLPPAQYDPARQIEHGLVPDLDPSPLYPAWHKHAFWDTDCGVDTVFRGHWFWMLLPEHQVLGGHWMQLLPSNET